MCLYVCAHVRVSAIYILKPNNTDYFLIYCSLVALRPFSLKDMSGDIVRFSSCQQIPRKKQNQQGIDPTSKYRLCS